jgi:hypothetical protein
MYAYISIVQKGGRKSGRKTKATLSGAAIFQGEGKS